MTRQRFAMAEKMAWKARLTEIGKKTGWMAIKMKEERQVEVGQKPS